MIYAVGAAIAPNTPTHSGGAIDRYGIEPALPTGLSIDAKSGVISGTPQAVKNSTLYTVTASNAWGVVTAGLRIEISQGVMAPVNLHYADEQPIYPIGQAITPNTPSVQGGAFTQATAAPILPAGLNLDPLTGAISGTPVQLSPPTDYTITVSNSAGSSRIVLRLSVATTSSAPTSLGYSEQRPLYTVGAPIASNQPVSTGGAITAFSVNPALPTGLSLDTTRGVITGTPQSLQAGTTHVITGSNDAGYVAATIVISVVAPGSSHATGSMFLGRAAATATLLPNGHVLVVGGLHGSTFDPPTNTAELYDPSNGQWKPTGSMKYARMVHTATLLADGKVLVAGGQISVSSTSSDTAELYDPATGAWTSTGSMSNLRSGHIATLLNNGKVLVSGMYGSQGDGRTAELYDPGTGQWTATGPMNKVRNGLVATLLPDGKVLAVGGEEHPSIIVQATAELYDPMTGLWTLTGSMSEARIGHFLTLLPNGKVLATGGMKAILNTLNTAEIYDPSSGQWTTTGSMSQTRLSHWTTVLPNGKVLALGGSHGNGTAPPLDMELYDPPTGTWTVADSTSKARVRPAATRLADGKVLITGGAEQSNVVELYVPAP